MKLRPPVRAGQRLPTAVPALLTVVSVLVTGCAGVAAQQGGPGSGAAGRPDGPASAASAASAAGRARQAGAQAARGRQPGARAHGRQAPAPPRRAPGHRFAGGQLITVTARRYGATYATFTAYRRAGGNWHRVFGPWAARLGRNGFAPPGSKREGDGRTPSGSFRFLFFFGVLPDPGVRFAYRRARPYDVWDDDPASPRYNEWVSERHANPGAGPEPMDVSGYDYGAVIGYNTARTPGLGSGIFLHVNIGIATAGCVTLPAHRLLAVLRWLDPARSPRIRMGVERHASGPLP